MQDFGVKIMVITIIIIIIIIDVEVVEGAIKSDY